MDMIKKLESTTDPPSQRFVFPEIVQCVPGIDLLSIRRLFTCIRRFHHQRSLRVSQMRHETVTIDSGFRGPGNPFLPNSSVGVVLVC